MKSKRRRNFIILGAVFAALLVVLLAYFVYVYSYNRTQRNLISPLGGDVCTLDIHPRGGETDSWIKKVENEGEPEISYTGMIYEGKITNYSSSDIAEWKLKLDINMECYLNNAWCGRLEIHQFRDKKESVQTLDLRNCGDEKITLDYKTEGPDLMIHMLPGDYVVYLPDEASNEFPIAAHRKGDEEESAVNIGLIFYYLPSEDGQGALSFNNFDLQYFLRKDMTQDIWFRVLAAAFLLWLLVAINMTAVELNMRKARQRMQQDAKIIEQSLSVFTRFFDAKDPYTTGHSERVAEYSRMIAERMGFSEEECKRIYYIAMMHDCGKFFIPDEILKKPGKLTDEEFEVIKTHTVRGAELLDDFTSLEGIKEGALYHHERYDGKGYPSGKKGEEIPLIGRIICVADAFDAMNSRRCYRDKLTEEHIISEFERNRGKQFDPGIVDCFLEIARELIRRSEAVDYVEQKNTI